MTQAEQILAHMERFGSITPLDAMQEYGIMRLGARIYDLKRRGVQIRTESVTAPNRYGQPTTFAKYTLEGQDDGQREV